MTQEAKDLQQRAVTQLMEKLALRNELTFRAPTGSGKTRMMADMMDRVLTGNTGSSPVTQASGLCSPVFLVSTLSKGDLARQNYEQFRRLASDGTFPALRPYLINTEAGSEERLFIPEGYNVYVLPRDLYKHGGRLMQGVMQDFLMDTVMICGHPVYLIKDECHQATHNLDNLASGFFSKVINFSATPNLRRGQQPDVEITDDEAVRAALIKHVEMGCDDDTVEDALCKLEEIQPQYRDLLGVNPCLIIQISNKQKAAEELSAIEERLTQHQQLKWMLIVDKEKDCRTNDKVGRLPVGCWKDYAKGNSSTVDVIVFKMVISEGWDIPRACMLYQVRDTQSRQLDEQVMGRVRRNPRLADYERLTPEAQQLATTAWVWGIPPEKMRRTMAVRLANREDTQAKLWVKTTMLKPLTERTDFVAEELLGSIKTDITHSSLFTLFGSLQRADEQVRQLCYQYADGNSGRWWHFAENIAKVERAYNSYICDYGQSMEVNAEQASFPLTSFYTDNANYATIADWVWRRRDGRDRFSFDSEAEREWAEVLKDLARDAAMTTGDEVLTDNGDRYLWGKNYLAGSAIRFEYYQAGIHASYPDFVMRDRQGRIHLFEVKSVNVAQGALFDTEEYKEKVRTLKECYRHCSRLTGQLFYLPVLRGDEWQITRLADGEEALLTKEAFVASLHEPPQ